MNELSSAAVLQMVVRATQLGLWDWEIATGRVSYSAEWKQQLGYAADELADQLEEWRRLVHPDDLVRMQRFIAEYLRAPTPHYEAEFRMRHRDGAWRWIRAYADLIRDAQGQPQRMLGSHLDITEFKLNEAALQRVNRILRLRSEVSAAVVRAKDEKALLQQVCSAAVSTGGYTAAWIVASADSGSEPALLARAGDVPTPLPGGPSAVSIPLLLEGGATFGVFGLVSASEEGVTATEQEALQKLAGDLALGIQMLRTRAERDAVLEALRRSQSRLAEAERIAHVGCWEWDRKNDKVYWSDEMYRILGLSPVETEPSWARLRELIHPDDHEHVSALQGRMKEGEPAREIEFRLVRRDGGVRHVLSRAAPPRQGQEDLLLGTLQDITERKQAEEALRANMSRILRHEASLLALTKPNPAAAGSLRLALQRLTEASARALQVARVSVWRHTPDRSAIECVDLYELQADRHSAGATMSAATHARYFAALNECEVLSAEDARTDARTAEFTNDYLRPLGIAAMMDVPIRLKTELDGVLCHEHVGEPRAWTPEERTFALAISNLVTLALEEDARQRAQEEQERSAAAYAALVGSVDGIVWEVDLPSYRFTFVSPQAERLLGYPVAQWLEEPEFWTTHMHPDDRTWAPQYCLRATEARQDHDFYYRMFHADGRVVWLHDLVTLVLENGEPRRLRGIMVDVTETKRAEEALHAREQEYRALVENSPDMVCRYGRDGRVLYVNATGERLLGRSRDQLVGRRPPDDLPDHAGLRNFWALIGTVFETGVPAETDLTLDFLPSASPPIHYIRLVPERNPQGAVVSVLGIGRDITSIRQTEKKLRETEERFRQAQKMEAVGRLAGGIAHDFNNLLAVIQLQSDLLLADQRAKGMSDGVQQIKGAAERASQLTRQLLTFSRREMPQARLIDLTEVMGSMSSLLRRVLGEDIALENEFSPALPLVQADPGMMEQVIMNLAVNARDAMPDGGRLTIALAATQADAAMVEAHEGVKPGAFVCLTVTDTGSGIKATDLPHVFEPFFTTKEVGRGTGLGLSTVFGIAQQHGGWVEVESEVGRGATFRFYLPAVLQRPKRPGTAGGGGSLPRGSEQILLVEDDPSVRPLARLALERFGYQVHTAESAAAALDVWEQHGPSIDLLLTDLVMPGGVGGSELAERLLSLRPDLKVMYMSGYSNDLVGRRHSTAAGRHFLGKPFSIADLLQNVRRCLDGE